MQKLNAIYNVAATQFKKDNKGCMAKLEGCNGITSDVHHLYSGASRSKFYLDSREWITVCVSCHHRIHSELSKEALFKLGLKKTDL